MHQLVSDASVDLVLRKNTVSAMRPSLEEVDLVIWASEGNGGQPGMEGLSGGTEPISGVQEPFQTTSLVRAPYPFRVQTVRSLMHETTHVRVVV